MGDQEKILAGGQLYFATLNFKIEYIPTVGWIIEPNFDEKKRSSGKTIIKGSIFQSNLPFYRTFYDGLHFVYENYILVVEKRES